MTIYFTADTHFQHANIIKFGRGNGQFKNINHHDQVLCKNWYETVQENDTIYVLGDIALGDITKSLDNFRWLPGRKFLVPGNHDKIFSSNSRSHIEKWWKTYEDVGFEILPEIYEITLPTSINQETPVLLSHFPFKANEYEVKDKHIKHRPTFRGLPLIHGHTHSENVLNTINSYEYHVGVDANNFTPVSETFIIKWLETLSTFTSSKKKQGPKQKHNQY
jgi:calcineurin-like phosphoesterase family protein